MPRNWVFERSGGSSGSGTPGGPANSVQFNSGPGAFLGSANLTWDNANQILKVGIATSMGQAIYLSAQATAPALAKPAAGYGGLAYQGGSIYWYFNATSGTWNTVDLAAAGGSVTPGGPAGAVQYNSGPGTFAGVAALTWDNTANQLLTTVNLTATGRILSNGTYSLAATAVPTSPSSGFAKWYFDNAAGILKISYYPTGAAAATAYIPLGAPGGANEDVQFHDSDGSFAGSGNFIFDKVNQAVTVTALNASSPGVIVKTGSVQADAGFYTPSTSETAVNALSGGVSANHINANQAFIHLGVTTAGAPPGSPSQGKLYYDATLHAWMVLQGTNSAVPMLGGGAVGGDKAIQYSSNGVMGGDSGLTYDYTPGVQLLTAANATITGRILVNGSFVISANPQPPVPAAGFAKIYLDSTSHQLMIAYNPAPAGTAATYIPFGIPGGANEHVQFKDSDGSFQGSANFIFDKVNQAVTITAKNATSPGLIVTTGSIQADAGFYTASTSNTALNALSGGVSAGHIITNQDLIALGTATGGYPAGAAHQGKLYFDDITHLWMVLQGTNAAVPMLGTSYPPGAPANSLQFNNGSGAFAGDADLTWNSSSNLLTVNGIANNPGITVANGYLQSAGGLYVSSSTAYNSIQTPGGVTALTRVNVYPNFTPDLGSGQDPYLKIHAVGQNGAIAIFIDAYDTSGNNSYPFALPGVIGRRATGAFGGSLSNLASGTPLFAMGGRGSTTSGFTTANASVISFQTAEAWTPSANGAEIVFATTKNQGTTRSNWMYLRNNGLLEVIGTSGAAGVLLDNGYMQANDAGYLANGAFVSVFNAPNGGASLGLAVYLLARGSNPSNPLSNYGGIGYNGGSTYWYWNGSGWATVNFASVGGGSGVSSVNPGTGVSVSPTTGAVTVSIGQAVGTGSFVTFGGITTPGSLVCMGIVINGQTCVDSAGIWKHGLQCGDHVYGLDFGIMSSDGVTGKATGAGSTTSANISGLPTGTAFTVACSDGYNRPVRGGIICNN